ncbi:hypothetical protein [Aeoliella sp. SH292]|uniref:hypothetical protein n=1 Tax=Aeoliella sp. SH292 TaxID=3454464 RepID=UPI003F9A4500
MLKILWGHGHPVLAVALLCTPLVATPARAFDVFWVPTGSGSWNTPGNWDSGEVPDVDFEDVAIINNGGTATLNTAALAPAGGITLGVDAGDRGTVHLQSGGTLNLVAGTGEATGWANIGLGGTGVVRVDGGATFSATRIDMNAGSKLEVGAGTGVSSVTSTNEMWLAGRTVTHGAGHTLHATTFATFQGGTEYVVNLKGATHTVLTADGQINDVQGPLKIQTTSFNPSLGATWTLMDAAQISGAFGSHTVTAGPLPAAGTGYTTKIVNGGRGKQLQMKYQALPTLTVNTDTGAISVSSESGAAINMVGYSIRSAGGQLNPAGWNSLADQSQPDWAEVGTQTANVLNEVNPLSSKTLNSTPTSLGTGVYVSPTQFGVAPDLTFRYGAEGDAASTAGIVKFTGSKAANNLLLTVDPTTGEGQLKNSSGFTIELLGYRITSEAGSLNATGWTSLDDQNQAGWLESAANQFQLNELVPLDPLPVLTPGQEFELGQMFNIGGLRDLDLSFAVSVAGGDPYVAQGTVRYGAIETTLLVEGDYNNDGIVNLADYTVWRDNLGGTSLPNEGAGISPGVVDAADYTFWKSRFGATSGAGAGALAAAPASVPEPSTVATCLMAAMALAGCARRR